MTAQKRILGVDLGDARTGLAVSDALGFLAGGIGYIKSGHMPKIAEEILAAANPLQPAVKLFEHL